MQAEGHWKVRNWRIMSFEPTISWAIHPGKLTWNLEITPLKREIIFQTSMIVLGRRFLGRPVFTEFHVQLLVWQKCRWIEKAAEAEISNRVKLCIDNSPMGAHGGSFCGSCWDTRDLRYRLGVPKQIEIKFQSFLYMTFGTLRCEDFKLVSVGAAALFFFLACRSPAEHSLAWRMQAECNGRRQKPSIGGTIWHSPKKQSWRNETSLALAQPIHFFDRVFWTEFVIGKFDEYIIALESSYLLWGASLDQLLTD